MPKRKSVNTTIPIRIILIPKVQEYPRGFPRLACFLDSDDAFMIYRRFGLVFSRLLLNKQDEIREMEATLLAMDRTDETEGNEVYLMSRTEDVGRHRDDVPPSCSGTRPQLLERLEKKILEYSKSTTTKTASFADSYLIAELLLKAQELKGLEKPSARDYRSVLHFMENDGGQVFEGESGWIYDKEDLITIRPGREHAWLDGFLERMLKVFRCRLLKVCSLSLHT